MSPEGRSSGAKLSGADRRLDNDQKVHLPGKEGNAAPWKQRKEKKKTAENMSLQGV